MPTPLEHRLHQLSADLSRKVAGIIRGLTIEELLALTAGYDVPAAKAPRKKTRPTPKAKTPTSTSIRHSPPKLQRRQGDGGQSTVSTPSTEPPPPPPSFRVVPPPEDRAAAFRRAEQERLESAVLKFVEQNPETDAEIVAVRVGLPKGQALGLLDDLVLKGRLRMKSGQHGRCYVVMDREGPWVT
ncbi:MAG TPA: hypothetical protein VM285_16085 [Polyangia bacterium]|nr:hypothetical protein [Polyangia bacterium]